MGNGVRASGPSLVVTGRAGAAGTSTRRLIPFIGGGRGIRDPYYPRRVSEHRPDTEISVVAAPRAAAGSGDPSRRWALAFPDGVERFAGITRPEGDAARPALAAMGAERWGEGLVEVTLAVVLTEGAGPYMLDAAGRITLVLGRHPALSGTHLAMGEPTPVHRIGLVRRRADGPVREWVVRADVPPDRRVAALDGLDAVTDLTGAGEWEVAAPR